MTRYLGAATAQGASIGASALISVVLAWWLARTLGPGGFALYGVALAVLHVTVALADGGWSTWLTRETAAGAPGVRLPRAAWRWTVVACLLSALAAGLLLHEIALAVLLALLAGVIVASNRHSGALRGARRFTREATFQFAGRLLSALAILAVLSWPLAAVPAAACGDEARQSCNRAVFAVLAVWLLALLAVLALFAWRAVDRRHALHDPEALTAPPSTALTAPPTTAPDARPSIVPRPASDAASVAFLLCALEAVFSLLTRGDVLVIAQLARHGIGGVGDAQVAAWAVSARVIEVALLAAAPVSNLMIGIFGQGRARVERSMREYCIVLGPMLVLGALVWLALAVGATWLQRLLFGPNYAAEASQIARAALPVLLVPFNAVALQLVIATCPPVVALGALFGAVAVFALVLPGLLWMGAAGAGWALPLATLCAQLVLAAGLLTALRDSRRGGRRLERAR